VKSRWCTCQPGPLFGLRGKRGGDQRKFKLSRFLRWGEKAVGRRRRLAYALLFLKPSLWSRPLSVGSYLKYEQAAVVSAG